MFSDLLDRIRVEDLGFSPRVIHGLSKSSSYYKTYRTLRELVGATDDDLLRRTHFGQTSINEIDLTLSRFGLRRDGSTCTSEAFVVTLRDHFAMAALTGLIAASLGGSPPPYKRTLRHFAKAAYACAEEMLKVKQPILVNITGFRGRKKKRDV